MTITIYAANPRHIVLYKPENFTAWKRVEAEGNLLPPGNYRLANMGHIYGIPKPETIIPIVSSPTHEGAVVGGEVYAEGSTNESLMESHHVRAEFG